MRSHPVFTLIGAWLLQVAAGTAAPAGERMAEAEPPIAGEVRASIEEIFSSPEYRRLRKTSRPEKAGKKEPEDRPSREPASRDGFSGGSGPGIPVGGVGSILSGLLYVLAFAAIAFAAGWIVKSILERTGTGDGRDGETAAEAEGEVVRPSEISADAHFARASALAAEGKHREAIRELVLGAMSWTERSRLIRFRRGLTNRDYLRALAGQAGPRAALLGMVDIFEEVFFGRRPATVEKYEECRNRYQEGFHGPPPAPTES